MRRGLTIACLALLACVGTAGAQDPEHSVNGVTLEPEISAALMPGLDFGAPLPPEASGGGNGYLTGVFVNGREIHPEEYQYLVALFGAVESGRYWLGPNMVGGIENYPASFDLNAVASAASGGGGGYNKSTLFGGLMSDGQCSGYLHPGGATVMTGNC